MVGLQALERGVCLALDRVRAQVAELLAASTADLRGQDDLLAVPAGGHPAADDRLRAAVLDQVGVRGVNEVAAGAGVSVQDGVGLRFVGGPAEHVAAEADGEHVEVGTSESGHVPHGSRCFGVAGLKGDLLLS